MAAYNERETTNSWLPEALIMGIDMFMRLNTVLGLNTPKISPARKQL